MIYEQRSDHNTGNYVPYSLRWVRGFFNIPASHYSEDAGDDAYGSPPLSEKTRISNHLQMSFAKAEYSPQLFKDPECWSGLGLGPETSRTVVRRSTNWANRSAGYLDIFTEKCKFLIISHLSPYILDRLILIFFMSFENNVINGDVETLFPYYR